MPPHEASIINPNVANTMSEQRVAIVGAGIAGLHCASILIENGIEVLIFDQEREVGGRMKTTRKDGFLLDHGFHVLQTAYPTASRVLDYKTLRCKAFQPGALVVDSRKGKAKIRRMADPWRQPIRGMMSAFNGFAGMADLLRVAQLRREVVKGSIDSQFDGNDATTMEWLHSKGFSESMIQRFFLPLFSGIFLESDLRTNERMFRFVFRMMAKGKMVLPAEGIGSVPEKMAEQIGNDRLRLGVRISGIDEGAVRFRGEAHRFDTVVKAFSEPTKEGLTRSVWTMHLDAEKAPFRSKHILLNGNLSEPSSLITHVAVPSNVQSSYAPDGRSLVTVTIVGDRVTAAGIQEPSGIEAAARDELGHWFGDGTVSTWRTLDVNCVEHALPEIGAGMRLTNQPRQGESGVIECGDYLLHGSVEGALLTAEKAAQEIIEKLKTPTSSNQQPMRRF